MKIGSLPRVLPLAVILVAAVGWAVALTVWRPAPPPGPRPVEIGTYWARDLRMALILLVAAALICSGRGRRGLGWLAFTGVGGWVVLDVLLDRAGVAGAGACVGLAVVACLALTGLWRLVERGESGHPSVGLYVAAALAATVAQCRIWVPVAPESAETVWGLSSWVLLVLGSTVLVGCLVVMNASVRVRQLAVAACALLALIMASLSLVRTEVLVLARYVAFLFLFLFLLTVIAGSAWSVRSALGWATAAGAVLAGWVVPMVLLMMSWGEWSTFLGHYNEWVIGDYLTALAGHRAAADPQAYTPSIYLVCLACLVFSGVVVAGMSVSTARGRATPRVAV